MSKNKTEAETRKSIVYQALRFYGPEAAKQVNMHFAKYDRILKATKNESELKHIKHLALAELYKMMGFYQGLVVDDQEVIPANIPPSKKE